MNLQKTLAKVVVLKGVALHSGKETSLVLRPAGPNEGISFVRSDLPGQPKIQALYTNVVRTQMATTLGANGVQISTVEHLMAALAGMEIDNLVCEVDGPEIPVMDGSSKYFIDAMMQVGTETQLQARRVVVVKKRIEVKLAEKWAVINPAEHFEVHASVDWDHPSIGFQEYKYIEGHTDFNEIAPARTFGFLRDYETLKQMGLARGASLENVVVLDDASVVNPDGLRFKDEMVRHKVLDSLGDFKLCGFSILGTIRLHRAGHDLHRMLLAEIFKSPDNYEIVELVPATQKGRKARRVKVAFAKAGLAATY